MKINSIQWQLPSNITKIRLQSSYGKCNFNAHLPLISLHHQFSHNDMHCSDALAYFNSTVHSAHLPHYDSCYESMSCSSPSSIMSLSSSWFYHQVTHLTYYHIISTPCLKKTVQTYFCQNFVKIRPIVKILGKKIAKRTSFSEVNLFSTSPN